MGDPLEGATLLSFFMKTLSRTTGLEDLAGTSQEISSSKMLSP